MEPSEHSTTTKTAADPTFRMQLATRGEAYCPVCGYSLHGLAAIFLAPQPPGFQGQQHIGAVCTLCYKTKYDDCLLVVTHLLDARNGEITETTHGITFYSPAHEKERGHPLAHVLHARKTNTPLPILPAFDTPDSLTKHDPTLWEPYDPPCPADVQ